MNVWIPKNERDGARPDYRRQSKCLIPRFFIFIIGKRSASDTIVRDRRSCTNYSLPFYTRLIKCQSLQPLLFLMFLHKHFATMFPCLMSRRPEAFCPFYFLDLLQKVHCNKMAIQDVINYKVSVSNYNIYYFLSKYILCKIFLCILLHNCLEHLMKMEEGLIIILYILFLLLNFLTFFVFDRRG